VEKVDIKGGYFIPKIDTKVSGLDQPFPKVEKVEKVEKDVIDSLKLDLSFLLNLLDGVLELPGRIVIMTSNYPEKLDHALIRPGRIDVTADFKKCTNETIIEMLEFFYDIELETSELKSIIQLEEYFISPAELGKWMFETIDDHKICIEKLLKTIPMVLSENTNTYDSQDVNDDNDELPELVLVEDIEPTQESYDTNECANMFSNFKDFDSFIHILNDLMKQPEHKEDTETETTRNTEIQEARDGENSELNPYSDLLADFMSAMSKESNAPDFNNLFMNLAEIPDEGNKE
jgi:SpoVK/Ycf46/Vps4 family AAA+-type ATPase